ncbi:hypothetical protein MMC30_001334 [Trapelia coarctata]|nr:hypothetical protein [Trapelia coarctata]
MSLTGHIQGEVRENGCDEKSQQHGSLGPTYGIPNPEGSGGTNVSIPDRTQEGPGPPPDGGLQAWTQTCVAHLVIFNIWGYINYFGVFQTYYDLTLGRSPSDISWVGSVQVFLLFFIGTFSGRATDAGYYRHIFILGTLMQLIGVFLTSLCTQYWQLFLAQGICTGIGSGLLFCPTLALVATYFSKKRAMAFGIVASGTTTGGVAIPGIVEALLPRIGFGWTVRVLGFIVLAFQLIALAFARTRLPPRKSGPLIEISAFRELPYTLFAIGIFFAFWGLYPAYYYIGEYAVTVIGLPYSLSVNFLIILNGIGIIGRLVPPYFADRYTGPTNMMIPFVLLSGITLYCWAVIYSEGGLWAFSVFYGLFSSAVNGLSPSAISSLTKDMSKMGVRMGMVFSIISFAVLTGSPIAGALISARGGSYLGMEMFTATSMVLGGLVLVGARLSGTGMKLCVRV